MRKYCFILMILVLGVSCTKTQNPELTTPTASVSSLICSSASEAPAAIVGSNYTGSITVPYSGGNGATYNAGTPVASSGVAGLTATLQGGRLANGSGTFSYMISGVPSEPGTASFGISFSTVSCMIKVTVNDVPLTQYGTPFTGVPDPRDAVIYQVNMRVFSSTRNFQGVINRLDSIKALGVNVIYLMPVYPVGVLK
jgi:hypothetical protein